jgi:Bacterial SH3 domain
MKKKIFSLLVSSTILLAGMMNQATAAELGTALKADTLRAEPFADAKSAGSLTKNESVEILNKKGAWLQIKTTKNTGWVRLLSVKRASTGGNSIKGAVDVASGRAGTGKVVSTTGIRGLSADELKAAKFNESEIKKLESYEVSASSAKQFASSGGLSATSIAYLKGTK